MTITQSVNLFTYGSLMCEDIMFSIAGACDCLGQARLDGYRRQPVRDETYPGITPQKNDSVPGVVYSGISDMAMRALDRFEGDMYWREEVHVVLLDNTQLTAFTYVVRPKYHHLLDDGGWDVDHFLRHGKSRFLSRYAGFAVLRHDD